MTSFRSSHLIVSLSVTITPLCVNRYRILLCPKVPLSSPPLFFVLLLLWRFLRLLRLLRLLFPSSPAPGFSVMSMHRSTNYDSPPLRRGSLLRKKKQGEEEREKRGLVYGFPAFALTSQGGSVLVTSTAFDRSTVLLSGRF